MQTTHPEPGPGRPPDHPPALPGPEPRAARKTTRWFWNPAPLDKPVIDPDLDQLGWPERCAEVVRHAVLSLEHWLSRGGWLREWIRLNLWLAVFLLVAALVVVPPVTALLEGVRDWTDLLGATIGNINVAVATLPPIVLALATGFVVVKLIQRHRGHRRPDRRHPYDPYD